MIELKAGMCLSLPDRSSPEKHQAVIVTDPQGEPSSFLCVNLTTHKDYKDGTVIFSAGANTYIDRPTSVFFAKARILATERVMAEIRRDRHFKSRHLATPEMLEQIRQGFFTSPYTVPRMRDYLSAYLAREK